MDNPNPVEVNPNWNLADAQNALKIEQNYHKTLIVTLPDPIINENYMKIRSSAIEEVKYEVPSTPRYCIVKLKQNANAEEICKIISKVKYEVSNKPSVEPTNAAFPTIPETIDPFTLHICDLPFSYKNETLKNEFPKYSNVIIQSVNNKSREAFIHFKKAKDAIEAYKKIMEDTNNRLNIKFKRRSNKMNNTGESSVDSKANVFEESKRLQKLTSIVNCKVETAINIKQEPIEDNNDTITNDVSLPVNIEDLKKEFYSNYGQMKREEIEPNELRRRAYLYNKIHGIPSDDESSNDSNENDNNHVEDEPEEVDDSTEPIDESSQAVTSTTKLIANQSDEDIKPNVHNLRKNLINYNLNTGGNHSESSTKRVQLHDTQNTKRQKTERDEIDEIFDRIYREDNDIIF